MMFYSAALFLTSAIDLRMISVFLYSSMSSSVIFEFYRKSAYLSSKDWAWRRACAVCLADGPILLGFPGDGMTSNFIPFYGDLFFAEPILDELFAADP